MNNFNFYENKFDCKLIDPNKKDKRENNLILIPNEKNSKIINNKTNKKEIANEINKNNENANSEILNLNLGFLNENKKNEVNEILSFDIDKRKNHENINRNLINKFNSGGEIFSFKNLDLEIK